MVRVGLVLEMWTMIRLQRAIYFCVYVIQLVVSARRTLISSFSLSASANIYAFLEVRAVQKKIPTQEKHKKQLDCSSLPLPPAHKYHSSLYPFYHDSSGVIQLELSVLRLLCLVYPCPTAHPHPLPLSGQPLQLC